MHVVYSRTRPALGLGSTYQNPRHFVGPVARAAQVTIFGEYPRIEAEYRSAGFVGERVGEICTLTAAAKPKDRRARK